MSSLSIRVTRRRLGDLASVYRSIPLDLGLAYIKTDIGSQRFSMDFKLRMTETVHDSYEWINLHTCARRRCMMQGRRVPFFHQECVCFRLYDISDALTTSGEWSFEPPASEISRRSHRIKNLLAPKLRDQLQIRLPLETLMTITGHLVRECAAVTAEEQSLGTAVSDTTLDIRRDIYANYTAVEGVRYVKSLCNTASNFGDQDYPTLLCKKSKPIDKIWIAEDHRGIRSVIFCGKDSPLVGPTPITKSWWRSLTISNDTKEIAIKSDGLKLRDIVVSGDTGPKPNSISWADPSHPENVIDIMTLEPIGVVPERLRMMPFTCNASGTTGYTAVTGGPSVAMIHAHGHDDTSFYADMDSAYPRDFFMHMPLDDGEYVTQICRRHGLGAGNRPSACFVFTTNKGRDTLFGTSGPPESCLALERMVTPAESGTTIWFNDSSSVQSKSLRYLACDVTEPASQRPFPASLVPNAPCFWTTSTEPWFVSSCSMEGLVAMTLCRDTALFYRPIIGILVEYENGHRECLGQYRFDRTLAKLRLDHATDLYIGSLRTIRSYLYVAEITTSPPYESGISSWMRVSRHGRLEWWSSLRHSIVRYTSATGQFTNIETRT
ncbi:uncharacterized protein FFB20_10513 [Fusarium fujikuroi]|uniref:Uncharacterized protein n=2 Tax=Fusarium fujikuroi TaxID=5127 RepID=S0EB26_GIBF5|nr:uncharacterized protein FFUJ_05550 [Fusarium fujikuroi IMI 58289]KLP14448.1 uncharacterized protein LW94_6238 [Fusarium fujikuroi]QGI65471.1 hypothetical protein CEK27_009442 [Fusarium fujikuroi]QGI82722.1 hypothetical protein CEK25_009451 [Fusarium fujikuroi]QGI96352.1 hypothetical protein CEK26_009421 [Fusarium fujikuroi]CCT69648.1 uncharacterized protein FFUJ_05550 [Fusarium fujikuroi IMI 58289]